MTMVEAVDRYAICHRGIDLPEDAFYGLIAGFEFFDCLRHVVLTPIDDRRHQRRKTRSVPGQAFSLANLREAVDALYGRRQWQLALARDLNTSPRAIKGWFNGKPLPDLREKLADLCRLRDADPHLQNLARKLEELGPPER